MAATYRYRFVLTKLCESVVEMISTVAYNASSHLQLHGILFEMFVPMLRSHPTAWRKPRQTGQRSSHFMYFLAAAEKVPVDILLDQGRHFH